MNWLSHADRRDGYIAMEIMLDKSTRSTLVKWLSSLTWPSSLGQVFKAWLHPGRCLFSLSTVWKPQFLISDLHVMARSFTLSCKNKLLLIDNCLMTDKRPGQSRQSDKITTSFYGLIWQNCKNLAVSFDENIARNKISNQYQCTPEVTYNFRRKEVWLSRFKKFESAEQPLWLSEWK